MSDLIDRQEAISRAVELRMYGKPVKMVAVSELERLPSARAEHGENSPSEQPQMNELGVKTGETCADTISRQALIDKLIKLGDYYNGRDEVKRGIHQCIAATYELPSAQPETHGKRTETHACDCISRQAAIHLIAGYDGVIDKSVAKRLLIQMPSAQPDRSLWFRIGEICVDESKGFISAGRAIEKIRELLREAERREE